MRSIASIFAGKSVTCAMMLLVGGVATGLFGCAGSSKETAGPDNALTAHVGIYPPGPGGVRPKVGVPPFKVETTGGWGGGSGGSMNDIAADQMTTLLFKTNRFEVIERTQLKKLLDEQNLEGIVKPGELARPGQVRGVDLLLIGKITNLRVKRETNNRNFGLAQVGGSIVNMGGLDVKKSDLKITTECGVDIRLVNPTTGQIVVAENSEYKRTDSAGAMGVSILGANSQAESNISVSEDDKGKILRLALDDAVRKSLVDVDAYLMKQPAGRTGVTPTVAPDNASSAGTPPAPAPTGPKFCPHCGKPTEAGAKFCPSCGKQVMP